MRKKAGILFSVSFIITILVLSLSLPYQAVAQNEGPDSIPGRYIVVLEEGVSPQDVIKTHGAVPDFVYRHALNGFAGPISPVILENLNQDPRVKFVEKDQRVYAFAQTTPTGIDRIDAEGQLSAGAADVIVAVLDTGIDDTHPDLNVIKKVNCSGGGPGAGEGILNSLRGTAFSLIGRVHSLRGRRNSRGLVG